MLYVEMTIPAAPFSAPANYNAPHVGFQHSEGLASSVTAHKVMLRAGEQTDLPLADIRELQEGLLPLSHRHAEMGTKVNTLIADFECTCRSSRGCTQDQGALLDGACGGNPHKGLSRSTRQYDDTRSSATISTTVLSTG
jgi:hypothetical protein